MRLVFVFFATLVNVAVAIKTRADPYTSGNGDVRRAKQRLLSMDANTPGIRYRVGDQLTRLVDMDTTIKKLTESAAKFQLGLANVSGIIDVSKSNDGLVPQMTKLSNEIKRLDRKLATLHRSASTQVKNLYNTANSVPNQLTKNLQRTIDNLVKVYNQLITNQVHSLDRQRKQSIDKVTQDARLLTREVQRTQQAQLVDIRKLIKKMQTDRMDILSDSTDLNTKFTDASGIVRTALGAVKAKSAEDLASIDAIVNKNKQELVSYINEQGDNWKNTLQSTIERAATASSRALSDMSKTLTGKFSTAQNKAKSDLSDVESTVDKAVGQVNRNIEAIKTKFSLSIKNATSVTDRVLEDLRQPIMDVNDQIAAAQTMLGGIQHDATSGASAISNNASTVAQNLVNDYKNAGTAIEGNGGFSALADAASSVFESATHDMNAAQTTAEARVAALQSQLGADGKTIGSISSDLQSTIDQQQKDFETSTQVQASDLKNKVEDTTKKLTDMAAENAAKVDDVKATADGQLADLTDRSISRIEDAHKSANSMLETVNSHLDQQAAQTNTLITGAFSGILSDAEDTLAESQKLSTSSDQAQTQIGAATDALNAQNKQINSDLESANSQVGALRQLGSNAVDQFYQGATAETSGAINEFSNSAAGAVKQYEQSVQGQVDGLQSAQQELSQSEAESKNALAKSGAEIKSDLDKAKDVLNNVKQSAALTETEVQNEVRSVLSNFKSGSDAEVSQLKSDTSAAINDIASELKRKVDTAGGSVSNQTQSLIENLATLSSYVKEHSGELDESVSSTSQAVSDFNTLVDNLISQISTSSDGLKLYYQNTTNLVDTKVGETEEYLNDTRGETLDKINEAWESLRTAMADVDGSTSSKIRKFRAAINQSVADNDAVVNKFTSYIKGMVEMERASAASRIAIQRGILNTILQHAAQAAKDGNPEASREMLLRLKSVLATATGAVGSSGDSVDKQKAAQDALINAFGATTADRVSQLMARLEANANSFTGDINSSSSLAAADSDALLQATGLGVDGIVGLAGGIASSVDQALDETRAKYRESQMAMAALSAETNNLSNITESQLGEIMRAMLAGQTMYSGAMDDAKKENGENIALISGVIRDFVTLVNQTLAESNDLISTVDANYTDASMKIGSKMDTVLGFITRQSNAVSDSAESSGALLKSLLTKNGAMEDGIRSRLDQLSKQQDAFSNNVHDQLQSFISRLNDDTAKMSSARNAATSKLYQKLQEASSQFAANAAQWQSQRVKAPSSVLSVSSFVEKDLTKMSDEELLSDVLKHADTVQDIIQA